MYQCSNCDNLYENPEDLYKLFVFVKDNIDEKYNCIEAIILCPHCGDKHVVGGEYYYDEIDDTDGVMLYGNEFKLSDHKKLPTYYGLPYKAPDDI
jgi:hypothetical protein